MCVSVGDAEFNKTIIMGYEAFHPELKREVHVTGYQNEARSESGPNAMILHFPAREPLTEKNFLKPLSDGKRLLSDAVSALNKGKRTRSMETLGMIGKSVEIFEMGIYTVLLPQDPTSIPLALEKVAPNKRPNLSPELWDFYKKHPDWYCAVLCFDNADATNSEPVFIWYEPRNPNILQLPGIDCHTGAAPDMDAMVDVDHSLIFGSYRMTEDTPEVHYSDRELAIQFADFLPKRVVGVTSLQRKMRNGDFACRISDIRAGSIGRNVMRVDDAGKVLEMF